MKKILNTLFANKASKKKKPAVGSLKSDRKLFSMDKFDHLFAEQAEKNAKTNPDTVIRLSFTL